MANSFSFDGTDMAGSTYGMTVLNDPLPLIAPLDVQSTNVPYAYGGRVYGTNVQPLEISFACVVVGSSWANLLTKLDAIKGKLYQESDKALIFDFQTDRRYMVRLRGIGPATYHGNTAAEFVLSFVCESGVAEAASATTQNVTVTASPHAFNVQSAATVAGTAYAPPVWTYTAAGSVTSLTLANSTTSETITWGGSLSSGHMLRFDAVRMVVEKSTDSGSTWTASMTSVGSGIVPTLKPGVQNSCSLTGTTSGTLSVVYRARYF